MAEIPKSPKYHFVDWSDIVGPTKNPAARVLIRKQAMSQVAAARRKHGQFGFSGENSIGRGVFSITPAEKTPERPPKCSETSSSESGLISPPLSNNDNDKEEDETVNWASTSNSSIYHDRRQASADDHTLYLMRIPPKMASTGYELLRMQSNFDVVDLSALTTFHVGRLTATALQTSPFLLHDVLRCRQWSYFAYVPGRFGHFTCLDDATRCVAHRVRLWMEGEVNADATSVSLYSMALKSLQVAIDNPDLRTTSETLCTTELLSVYALLENTKGQGWAQHAAGAKSLLRLRGPRSFVTSFDKALFMAQVGQIYTESLIDGLGCFLDEPEWQDVLKSVVQDPSLSVSPLSDRGNVVVSLWTYMLYLPNIWNAVQSAVCSDGSTDDSKIQYLRSSITDLDIKISEWRAHYESLLKSVPDITSCEAKEEKRFETLGSCLICHLILKRLAVALDPLSPSAAKAEMEVQTIAGDVLEIEKTAIINNPRAGLFMKFKKIAAEATIATKDDWLVSSVVDARVGVNGMIAPWVFERWCNLKGRSYGYGPRGSSTR